MPAHYETIRTQLIDDVGAALGDGARVVFGRMVKPKGGGAPVASIVTGVQRGGGVRKVREDYSFLIGLMVALPPTSDLATDVEGLLLQKADALVMLLAPYSATDVPAPAGRYAGVGYLRKVSSVKPMEREDTDNHVGVWVEFSCAADVFQ